MNLERMDLDDPDTDGTDGDDEKEPDEDHTSKHDLLDTATVRQESPELEEILPRCRRLSSRTSDIAEPVQQSKSAPPPQDPPRLNFGQIRSQSVRSTTGLENLSQVEKALYELDSIATATYEDESMAQSAGSSTVRSSLLRHSLSSQSSKPTSASKSTKSLKLPSSSLPRVPPQEPDSDVELVQKPQPRSRPPSAPSSVLSRPALESRGRASMSTMVVATGTPSARAVIEISSGEEDDSGTKAADNDIIFVKEEFPGSAQASTTATQAEETVRRSRSTSKRSKEGGEDTQESMEI